MFSLVCGFDIGNHTSVVANNSMVYQDFKHQMPTAVSFLERKRHFGFEALSLSRRNPASTISQIKRIIGKQYKCPGI